MKFVFVNGRVAIVVRYWEEPASIVDGGARVELRRVDQVEGRNHRPGAAGFTVGSVSDGGLWRADLFAVLDEPGRPCFHYHPKFEHDDVGERDFDDALGDDPRAWIADKLADLPQLLAECGAKDLASSVDENEHRRAMPLILLAVDSCLAKLSQVMTRPRSRG